MSTMNIEVTTTFGTSTTHTLELPEEQTETIQLNMNLIKGAVEGSLPSIILLEPFVHYKSSSIAYVKVEFTGPEDSVEEAIEEARRVGFQPPTQD